MNRNWVLSGIALVLLTVVWRIVPHAANVTPLYAVALFACAVFPRRLGIWVPFVAMVVSDLIVGMHDDVLFTWSGMLVFMALGYSLSQDRRASRIAFATLAGSFVFFVWTNFGVFLVSDLYPRTGAGLVQCYLYALPFFRNSLLGDLALTGTLFAAYEWVRLRSLARVAVMAS